LGGGEDSQGVAVVVGLGSAEGGGYGGDEGFGGCVGGSGVTGGLSHRSLLSVVVVSPSGCAVVISKVGGFGFIACGVWSAVVVAALRDS
jgi:hypothetical protein